MRAARGDPALLEGADDGRGPARRPGLAQDGTDVLLHGLAGQDQLLGDLPVAQAAREQAAVESEQLVSRARREAEQVVNAAKKQAESLRNSGHADSERELQALQAEVDRLARRRDSITSQLAQLRDVVAGFGSDD